MASRRRVAGAGWTPSTGLSTSSADTSGTAWFYTHRQSVFAMYERRNSYNSQVSSNTVVTPVVNFNYLDLNVRVTTTNELFYGDVSGGTFVQYQDLVLTNNGTSGGFGSSGSITTSAVGIIRRPATLVNGLPNQPSGSCSVSFNIQTDNIPGQYDINSEYDSSSTVQPHVYELLKRCKDNCPDFDIFLVNL